MTSPRLSRVKAAALGTVRRGRRVAWTPEFMGFGNHLYLLLWAAQGHWQSEPRYVRATPRLDPWLIEFPELRRLVILPQDVRFTDQRMFPWSQQSTLSDASRRGYSDVERESFIRQFLLPREAPRPRGHMTVNVRRGDYYSSPDVTREFGFDVDTYLRLAVDAACSRTAPDAIKVVSDDPGWCRENLEWMNEFAPMSTSSIDDSPADNFWDVAASRQLVITNSTFSYWAAYTSNVTFADNHADVWAPRFFSRTSNGGRSWQLDERWSIIEDLPSGWDGAGETTSS